MTEYQVVTTDTLERIAAQTGYPHQFLKNKLQDATYRDCSLVVFKDGDGWRAIFISNHYSIPWVMEHLSKRWGFDEAEV